TGWKNEEALGQPLESVFHIVNEQTRQIVENPATKALTEGVIVGLANHTVLIAKDGSERPIDDSAAPIRVKDGVVIGCVLVFRDVTERRRQEQSLDESRSRLESTLAAAEIGTWEFDPNKNVVIADKNLAQIFGFAAEIANQSELATFISAIHPADRDRVVSEIERALATEDRFESEYRLGTLHGPLRWVIARGRIERDAAGHAIRMPGVVVDTTRQREAEAEILRLNAESERLRRLYDTMLSNSADFNYTFDLQGRFTYVNRALLNLWQRDLSQAVGKTFFELDYPPELAAQLHQQIQKVIDTRLPVRDETPYTSHSGERQYEYIFVPVIGSNGGVEAVAGSTRDITDQKRVHEQLKDVAARLSEADRRKDEFLATLAHELRNPLAPIRTGLEVMKFTKDDPASMEEIRSMMERQAQQMVRLIDDLLDMSRITQGKLELRKCQVAISDIVQSAVEATQPFVDEANHELEVTLPATPIMLDADPSRLAQVISNLLNNSTKYTPERGHIWLSVERVGSEVAIKVKDNGFGIPPEMQRSIFEMFSQIDRPIEKGYRGLGIGLALVKRLVEMHGGRIEVYSAGTDCGSEFTVTLPIPVDPPIEPAPTQISKETPSSSHRVLVVDDNTDAAHMLSLVVKMLGNEVRIACNGLQAVQFAEEFAPDVVLMDIGMPQMDGYEAAQHIRQQPWGTQMVLVALTGWGQEEDKRQAKAAGFDHHLVKPADPSELQQLLARIRH
ncbi:MAG: hypothetical protein JWN70_5866, partial [Planctomycetaceae bacterium]|nr:hypothetical protein [Planctomycetaceae bacterium]